MRRLRFLAAPLCALLMVLGMLAFTGTAAQATPDNYTPKKGVRVNNPLGTPGDKRRIIDHLIRTINSTPRGSKIRIATWNLRSDAIVNALIAAHNRHISVRTVIDRLNANRDNPNWGYERLTKALKRNNMKRRPEMRSFTRRCVSACRAPHGIAHTKFFLFSRAGKTRDVVMFGSANATDLAAYYQWNDLYTVRRDPAVFDEFLNVFNEMARDTKVAQPYLAYYHGPMSLYFYPYSGEGTEKDPTLSELNKIECRGATNGTGTNGRTKIRIAMTSMHGERGIAIAERVMQMWNRGCDVKLVYAVLGNEILRIFRRGGPRPLPFRQIAQDFNLDRVYDRYLHMKTMTVSGVYDGQTDAQVTWNGSANWTSVALASDEVVARIFDPKVTTQYADWIEWLYAHPPRYTGVQAAIVRRLAHAQRLAGIKVDRYAKVQED